MQLEFLLFVDVGPKDKKTLSFFGVRGERKTGMSDELRQSSTNEIIFKLPIPSPPKIPPLPHKTKILDLKTKHDQIIKKSSISNICWFSVQKWWHKNKHIKLIFQVLIVKNHFFVIQPLKCKMFTSLTIARTYMSARLWVLWPVLRGSPNEFLPQQNCPCVLVHLPPTVVWVDDLWPLCSINYHRHVGHHHWPFDK